MDGSYLPTYFYINHHDSLTQQENDILMDHYKENKKPEKVFTLTKAIKVDTNDETANKLRQQYNELIKKKYIREGLGDFDGDNNLDETRKKLIEMANARGNNAVNFTMIIEHIHSYATTWRSHLPQNVLRKLPLEREDPRLLKEQAHVAGIKAQALAKLKTSDDKPSL